MYLQSTKVCDMNDNYRTAQLYYFLFARQQLYIVVILTSYALLNIYIIHAQRTVQTHDHDMHAI